GEHEKSEKPSLTFKLSTSQLLAGRLFSSHFSFFFILLLSKRYYEYSSA
ncbi:hypothetical protein X975_22892, partial [Stegodyphus mimosarum]